MKKLRCLIADDSALSRKIVRMALESIAEVEVVGTARNGQDAVERCKQLKPDLVTMDQEMPIMNGIEAVRKIRTFDSQVKMVMVSSLTSEGAAITNQALQAGAFDFVTKPNTQGVDASVAQLSKQLSERVSACQQSLALGGLQRSTAANTPNTRSQSQRQIPNPKAICIGVSTGGPAALGKLVPQLPSDLPAPVVIVQHMPAIFTKSLADQLDRSSAVNVIEAEDGQVAKPGSVYVAPGGKQMKLTDQVMQLRLSVNDDPPECNAKPSVDYLFRSAASELGGRVIAMVLTGMGDDGLLGCQQIRQAGGYVMTQDAASCVVYGMPRRVEEAGQSDFVGDLNSLAAKLTSSLRMDAAACK